MQKSIRKAVISIPILLAILIFYHILNRNNSPDSAFQTAEQKSSISDAGNTATAKKPDKPKNETTVPSAEPAQTVPAGLPMGGVVDERFGYASAYGELPNSLAGIDVPNGLRTDDQGNLVISMEIRNVFEFFMAGSSEEPLDAVAGRIREFISHKLPPKAAEEANRIFDNYMAYKRELEEHREFSVVPSQEALANLSEADRLAMVANALQFRKDARRKYMRPEVVDAFFGDEEAYDEYSLQLIELNRNTGLSQEEKDARLEELEEHLPAHMKEWRRKEKMRKRIESEILELSKQPGNEEEIHRLRTEAYGPEAAERMAKRDKEQEWSRRLKQYRKVVGEIASNPELSDEEKQGQIDKYCLDEFSDDELERLDRIVQ